MRRPRWARNSNGDACLWAADPFEAHLRALAAELDIAERVVFEPFVPHQEVPGWLTLFDVLLLPSLTARQLEGAVWPGDPGGERLRDHGPRQ